MKRGKRQTLLLEEVTALKAGTETINGLSSLANPETNAVDRSPKGSHFHYCSLLTLPLPIKMEVEYPWFMERAFWGFHQYQKLAWPITNCVGLFQLVELGVKILIPTSCTPTISSVFPLKFSKLLP